MENQNTDNKQVQKKKILLVEDSEICQLATKNLLEELHYLVDVAKNGKEALELLKNYYDIILLDIGLPDIDGISLTRMIRSKLELKLPIIAITDYSWDKKSYDEVHINDMLRKPVTLQGLTHMLKKYL